MSNSYAQIKNVTVNVNDSMEKPLASIILYLGLCTSIIIAFMATDGVPHKMVVNALVCVHIMTMGFLSYSCHKGRVIHADKDIVIAMVIASSATLSASIFTDVAINPTIDMAWNFATAIYFWEVLNSPKKNCEIVAKTIINAFK